MIYGTDICDSMCKHCLIWAKRPVKHLPKKQIIEIMKSKCVTKSTTVGLEGGEFLLHPEAFEILDWFYTNHPNFDLLSNCLKPEKVIEAVKKYPPQRLFISLDGGRDTYKYMRGKDGYHKVIEVIEACKDLVPISAMFTLSPYNSFEDLDHVIGLCKKNDIDVRVGIYNDIALFDTIEKAHEMEIGSARNLKDATVKEVKKKQKVEIERADDLDESEKQRTLQYKDFFKDQIPQSVRDTPENLDFLFLYDEWRKGHAQLKCYSILDSAVIHPNGDVPICQNLDTKLGNIYEQSLDEVLNSSQSCQTQKSYVNNCNKCWINFHRKYDIIMLRTLEKFLPRSVIEIFYGKYKWCFDGDLSYREFMKKCDSPN
ncbi:MAG: radical SAM protein [Ekhidna sp.]